MTDWVLPLVSCCLFGLANFQRFVVVVDDGIAVMESWSFDSDRECEALTEREACIVVVVVVRVDCDVGVGQKRNQEAKA